MSGFFVPMSSSPPTTPGKTPGRMNGSLSFLPEHPSTTPAGPPPQSVFSTTPAGPPPSATFGSSQLGTQLFGSKLSSNGSRLGTKKLFKTSPKMFGSNRGASAGINGKVNKPSFLGAHRIETTESASASEVDDGDEDDGDDEDANGEDDYDDDGGQGQSDEEQEEEGDEEELEEDEDASYTQTDAEFDAEGETDEDDYESDSSEGERQNAEHGEGTEQLEDDDRESTPKPFGNSRPPEFMNPTASAGAFDWAGLNDPTLPSSTGLSPPASQGTKRSRGASTFLVDTVEADLPPAKRRESALPRIAREFAQAAGTTSLHDPDELIIGTEDAVERLLRRAKAPPMARSYAADLANALESVPRELARLWKNSTSKLEHEDENMGGGIGPSEDSDGATKAAFLADILLRLYFPGSASGSQTHRSSRRRPLGMSTELIRLDEASTAPYPRVLLDFLDAEHQPLEEPLKMLYAHRPNPVANPKFWDLVVAGLVRGHLQLVRNILHNADFKYAWRPREEGSGGMGYSGSQLHQIHSAVARFVDLLASCPAVRDDDWDVPGPSWQLFRKRCDEELAELSAGGALAQPAFSLSGRTSTTGLPERIHSNLKIMYGILLGKSAEILSVSLDWMQATISLTAWWNGLEANGSGGFTADKLKTSRRTPFGRQADGKRPFDANPGLAYRQRLAHAVDVVTNGPDDDALMVDTNNAVEVGLASVFEGNLEGVFAIMQTWSLPITSAMLELFRWAGIYRTPNSTARPEGFDDSDLMVLSYAKPDRGITKDDVNLAYSDQLFEKAELKVGRNVKEGWELAVDVSSRLNDSGAAETRMAWLLSRIVVETDARANKIAMICEAYGMAQEARKACESFADHISTTSHNYGTALIYYARAHNKKKCKEVLDLLVSMCLVRSTAYPPSIPDASSRGLDPHMAELVASPQESINALANVDVEAANILSEHISGYATLRRFYDLRDQDIVAHSSLPNRPSLRPRARLRAAAKAILACIASAGDSVQGGLFDASLESVIPIDALFPLLAEAGEFLGRADGEHVLSTSQLMGLLRAIEDLQTVHSRIRAKTEDCLRACLDTRWDANATANTLDPSDLLRKSVSGLTDSSAFSLIGSEISEASANGKARQQKLAKKDGTPRAWDWRDRYGLTTTGDDLLSSLRAKVANEIAALWIEDV